MCSRKLFVVACFVFLPVLVFGQNGFNYKSISQDDWAVVLVRGLNLDENRELVKIEDFAILLNENGIAPKDGWQANQKLTYQDYAGTIGLALIYLNSRDSKKKSTDCNKFLSFLENKIGLNLSQFQAALQRNENLKNLNESVSNYLAQKQEPASNIKSKAGQNSNPILAGPFITSLNYALWIRYWGVEAPGYWKIFSKPASPILPYQPAP